MSHLLFISHANTSHNYCGQVLLCVFILSVGLTAIGLCNGSGAFWYLMAISGGGYYSQQYETPDDGTAMLTALTKCDRYSWCAGLRDDNLTMTRESWCVSRSLLIS